MKRQAARDCNDKEPSKNAMVTPRTQLVFDTAGRSTPLPLKPDLDSEIGFLLVSH
jgi:hypothetical protein